LERIAHLLQDFGDEVWLVYIDVKNDRGNEGDFERLFGCPDRELVNVLSKYFWYLTVVLQDPESPM